MAILLNLWLLLLLCGFSAETYSERVVGEIHDRLTKNVDLKIEKLINNRQRRTPCTATRDTKFTVKHIYKPESNLRLKDVLQANGSNALVEFVINMNRRLPNHDILPTAINVEDNLSSITIIEQDENVILKDIINRRKELNPNYNTKAALKHDGGSRKEMEETKQIFQTTNENHLAHITFNYDNRRKILQVNLRNREATVYLSMKGGKLHHYHHRSNTASTTSQSYSEPLRGSISLIRLKFEDNMYQKLAESIPKECRQKQGFVFTQKEVNEVVNNFEPFANSPHLKQKSGVRINNPQILHNPAGLSQNPWNTFHNVTPTPFAPPVEEYPELLQGPSNNFPKVFSKSSIHSPKNSPPLQRTSLVRIKNPQILHNPAVLSQNPWNNFHNVTPTSFVLPQEGYPELLQGSSINSPKVLSKSSIHSPNNAAVRSTPCTISTSTTSRPWSRFPHQQSKSLVRLKPQIMSRKGEDIVRVNFEDNTINRIGLKSVV